MIVESIFHQQRQEQSDTFLQLQQFRKPHLGLEFGLGFNLNISMSPNSFCAKSVIPTVATSPSILTTRDLCVS